MTVWFKLLLLTCNYYTCGQYSFFTSKDLFESGSVVLVRLILGILTSVSESESTAIGVSIDDKKATV